MTFAGCAGLPREHTRRRIDMRRIIVTEFISLDGVMEDPGGAEGTPFGGWAFKFERGPEGDKYKFDELMVAEHDRRGRVC
jgi:hypothetical protein